MKTERTREDDVAVRERGKRARTRCLHLCDRSGAGSHARGGSTARPAREGGSTRSKLRTNLFPPANVMRPRAAVNAA